MNAAVPATPAQDRTVTSSSGSPADRSTSQDSVSAVNPSGAEAPTSGAGPPGQDHVTPPAQFASVLTGQVARTAPAEGQKKLSSAVGARRSSKAPTTGAATDPTAAEHVPASPAPPAPAPPTPIAAAQAAAAAAQAAAAAAAAAANRKDAPTSAGAHPAGPATDASTAGAAAAALPAAPKPAESARAKAAADIHSGGGSVGPHAAWLKLADVEAKAAADGHPSATHLATGSALPTRTAPATQPLSTSLTAVSGLVQASAASLVGAARGANSASSAYGVRLAQMVDKVRTTIEIGARQGSSLARIVLSPESLGGLQIHLTSTSEGLVARIVAEHPEAAQTLQQSADELRRSLQSGGLNLLRLDIESPEQRGAANSDAGTRDGSSAAQRSDDPDTEGNVNTNDPTLLITTLPAGSLVNVLA